MSRHPSVQTTEYRCTHCDKRFSSIKEWDEDRACTLIYTPCEHCGGLELCAPDCGGMLSIFGREDVHIAQEHEEVRCKGCGRKRECRYGYCFECATWGEQRALSAKVAERMGRPDIAAAILKAAPR